MAEHVSWKKITKAESPYLGEWDLPVGQDTIFTIVDAKQEEIKIPAKGIAKTSLVITFKETNKKFVCNMTNGKAIERATGSRLLDEWIGKKIQMYVDNNVRFGNDVCAALRVKPRPVKEDKPTYTCSVCGKVIDEKTHRASVAKYGKSYCSKECLEKDTVGKDFEGGDK